MAIFQLRLYDRKKCRTTDEPQSREAAMSTQNQDTTGDTGSYPVGGPSPLW